MTVDPDLPAVRDNNFLQHRVASMVCETCEGCGDPTDPTERADRFLEEALELYQALGHSASRARRILSYVFGRPAGEVYQEVGGAQVSLMALCDRIEIDALAAADAENERCRDPAVQAKIRAKRAARIPGDPLPAGRLLPGEAPSVRPVLTPRESEILGLLASGHSNKSVARELGLSVRTVETHRLNFRRKSSSPGKVGLVALARALDLV